MALAIAPLGPLAPLAHTHTHTHVPGPRLEPSGSCDSLDLDALGRLTLHQLLKLPGVRDVRSSLVLEALKGDSPVPLTAARG